MKDRTTQSLWFVEKVERNLLIKTMETWGQTKTSLTFFAIRLSCLLFFHHVTVASGREPVVLHSTSYLLSADTCFSFVNIVTVIGFTATNYALYIIYDFILIITVLVWLCPRISITLSTNFAMFMKILFLRTFCF